MSQQINSLNPPILNFAVDSNKNAVELSVIIPVYKNLKGLKSTISDIRNSQIPVSYEIIVCNDGADRFISDWLTDQGIFEVKITKQKGSYFARNRGIEAASANWFLFVDSDVTIKPMWFKSIENYLENYLYIAFSITLSPKENDNLFLRYSVLTEFQTKVFFETYHYGVTAFLMVHRSVFNSIGLFDESLKSGGDLEFGERVFSHNIKQVYQSEKFVLHAPRSPLRKIYKGIRSNKGLLELSIMGKIKLYDGFNLKTGFLLPFKSIYRIYKTTINGKTTDFSKTEIIIAETVEQLIVLLTFYITLCMKPFYWVKRKAKAPKNDY